MTLALAQVFHAFDARSQNSSVFTSRLFTNVWLWGAVAICLVLQAAAVYLPIFQSVLHTVPPTTPEWAVIAACGRGGVRQGDPASRGQKSRDISCLK
jgi:Ca2+-transporting ATPase